MPGPLVTVESRPDLSGPVEIATRVWWVGTILPGDSFQCHAYLLEAGEDSVLIDPGSVLTIDGTLEKVAQIIPVEHVRWIVCHHADPDIAAGLGRLGEVVTRGDARLVTEWRGQALLVHYAPRFEFYRVEEHDWAIELPEGRRLRFVLTPYLHFPGAMCSFEESTGVLFSSDLFGGFTDGDRLVAVDGGYFESIRPFHEHYMPSADILGAGLLRLRRSFPDIRLIAPQHGCVIPESLVDEMFGKLGELECGIFLLAREDLDVARLMQVASALRRITDALLMSHDLTELVSTAKRVLPDVLPVISIEVYVDTADEGSLRFTEDDGYAGAPGAAPKMDAHSLRVDLEGEPGAPPAFALIRLAEQVGITRELAGTLARLAPALRVALDRHLAQRTAEQRQSEFHEEAVRDALTGLYNRRALEELHGLAAEQGVLLIDIDRFKTVNDRYGHDAGDEVLQRVAEAITASVRGQDLVVRYGGEEIVVLLRGADPLLTEAVAERIRSGVESTDMAPLVPDGVTVSVGAAMQGPDRELDEAITRADAAMYSAKTSGRNRVSVDWEPAGS